MSNAPCPPDRLNPQVVLLGVILTSAACLTLAAPAQGAQPAWKSPNRCRLLLTVDSRGVTRSNSPASVDVNFVRALADQKIAGTFDEHR